MFVEEKFKISKGVVFDISKCSYQFGFNGFGELVYYTNYSRLTPEGKQETWIDTCQRVVEGVFSIRKSWYKLHSLKWDSQYWDSIAAELLYYIYTLKILPPGRGLWAQGTDYVYKNGSMALNNCAGTLIESKTFAKDLGWAMDALMCGCGVGVRPVVDETFRDKLTSTTWRTETFFRVADSRQGWVNSVVELINSYRRVDNKSLVFDYNLIRKKGAKIVGFGGTSSGPKPLIILHDRIRVYMKAFIEGSYDYTRLSANIVNAIGACIIAGNVRRSAELILGSPYDKTFKNLSNYDLFPERSDIGWMSNNANAFKDKKDFLKIDEVAEQICDRGEGGLVNFRNILKYERFGDIGVPDEADCCNPCGEIPIYNKGLCNLFEVYPSKAKNKKEFLKMCRLATIYATTVALFPTHDQQTNQVIAKNRRIGISLSGVADWFDSWGGHIINFMRSGYGEIKEFSKYLNTQAGVSAPIRITTVKPSGSVSQLSGVSPGMHFPVHGPYAIRRMRISNTSPVLELCAAAGLPIEEDVNNKETTSIIEYPIYTGETRSSGEVSAWEQGWLLSLLQREWSDNMVSCTIHFKEKEKKSIPRMLAYFLPTIKSVSFLLEKDDHYPQMPYQKISVLEYNERVAKMKKIDWGKFGNSDGKESKFCSNDVCEVS
jgi:ribonucleoside-diphosphate reductase alpha chain